MELEDVWFAYPSRPSDMILKVSNIAVQSKPFLVSDYGLHELRTIFKFWFLLFGLVKILQKLEEFRIVDL